GQILRKRNHVAFGGGIRLFFFQAEDGIRDRNVTGVQKCALPISDRRGSRAPPRGPTGTSAAWTLKLTGDVRWQQVTPAGALLVSTDAALAGVDIDRGQVLWEKADLGGLPTDSVRLVEGSLLVEAARPGLLVILDPVTGAVLFDSRRPGLTQIVTRRVLPQSGTLLVHGRRANGPAVVALYDLVTGEQRWVNEGLFEQTEPKKKGLGGL